jgi:NAD(P)-dependent dehydrogenase (short-subunit alcohol dehydrogenase family)
MAKDFKNKVVIVTGASQGIGRGVALAFAREGAKLVLAARSAEKLAHVEEEVRGIGAQAMSVTTDVTSEHSVEELVSAAHKRFGRIDVLVNNAGIGKVSGVESATFEDDVHQTMEASLFGMIRVTRHVLPFMRQQGSGAIVNMSSVMGTKSFERFGSYAITMHGVVALSDALRQELAGTGIGVSIIQPALIATDLLRSVDENEMPLPFRHMTPLTPDQVGRAVLSAARRGAPRIVLPRVANMLLLGEAVSPRIGDFVALTLSKPLFARFIGMSDGTTYHHVITKPRIA